MKTTLTYYRYSFATEETHTESITLDYPTQTAKEVLLVIINGWNKVAVGKYQYWT